MSSFSIMILVKTPDLATPVIESLKPYPATVVSNITHSFSRGVNSCVVKATNEIVVICSHKARPTKNDVDRMIKYINDGYGLVALYRFGFFGFSKDLIRQIGFFDERFTGGGYEDHDFIMRLNEKNISYIFEHSIIFISGRSTWNYSMARPHFIKKWQFTKDKNGNTLIKRLLDEEPYKYNIGPTTQQKFRPRNDTLSKIGHPVWRSYENGIFI